ncbi:P-loop containing nucleoside triphosphate hydrolase protein [Hymenopellis radicata]|nr:P-loop containing nucleoside triphosphate hydrolase protein [Hymenopellis radicata]
MWDTWLDTSAIPVYATISSMLLYSVQLGVVRVSGQQKMEKTALKTIRRPIVSAFLVARAICCALILALTLSLLWTSQSQDFERRLGTVIASGYTVILACASALRITRASTHAVFVLLIFAITYIYRDLFPFATYTQKPLDASDGWRLWTLVALLVLSGIVLPALTPAEYTPLDQDDTATDLNAEQQASFFSRLVYSYLDSFTFSAIRRPESVAERIPSLAYVFQAKTLKKRSFPIVDPFSGGHKEKHLFWTLLQFYRSEFFTLVGLETLKALLLFVGPIGVNRLLSFLENNGEGATVRPWVWILWLFIGPFLRAVVQESFTHIATRILVSIEGILIQLMFEHSLRVRLHYDPSDNSEQGQRKTKSESKNLVGRINTLATTDLANVLNPSTYWITVMFLPVQIILCIIFLYVIVGWSALVGLAVLLVGTPLLNYLAKQMKGARVAVMKQIDARVQKVSEVMSILRMIKFFGWEHEVQTQIGEKRQEELRYLKRSKMLDLITANLDLLIPVLSMLATYATFTLVMNRQLTAAVVFSSLSIFAVLRSHLGSLISALSTLVGAKVSLDRIDDFIHNTELLDAFTQDADVAAPVDVRQELGLCNAEFTWSTSATRPFRLRVHGRLTFGPGINLITGPTGSGKTSLLMALLGEMHYTPSSADAESWFNLPRGGGVAYVAQESWVLNETIRDNILFGQPFDEARYEKVLFQCALHQDLTLLGAGDKTEVGENGLTLSGGQKARITLARAVYSNAEILLMDDILAALDVHTAKDLMEKRTVLLTTHNIALTRPLASWVVRLDSNGVVTLPEEESSDNSVNDNPKQNLNESASGDGKLILARSWKKAMSAGRLELYVGNLSRYSVLFWMALIASVMLQELLLSYLSWYLGHWAAQYQQRDPTTVSAPYYLKNYAMLLLVSSVFYSVAYAMFTFGSLRAAKVIHDCLIDSVTRTTLRWLDFTPTSRVIARTTVDIATVDTLFAFNVFRLSQLNVELLVKFAAILFFNPAFLGPGLLITALGGLFGQIYMRAQLPVKRVSSNARSPVIGHFGSAIAGVVSIRAYGAQDFLIQESLRRIDRYLKPTVTFYTLNRWICIRTEALAGLFTGLLAFYLIYGPGSDTAASNTGFSITTAMLFSGSILTWVRLFNRLELLGALERILHYIKAEQEPKPRPSGVPPAYWPSSGDLRVENLSARYSKDGPEVLHNLSFEVKSGEHIGVVGRTGSGKSTLTLSLLRCIVTEGEVFYDGLPTRSINLDALRASVTIIPQMPELLSGTLRYNLDPFSQYDDAVLNDALRSSGLFALQEENHEARITLDTPISSGGSNLSVGQRQIIALARAIVRGSKLLILDEATSAIDYKTDTIIQQSLRNELGGVTLLTIAHRLQTIMDFDKILVLDSGRIVEFDAPQVLLKEKDGWLRRLVDESSDKTVLYSMAGL